MIRHRVPAMFLGVMMTLNFSAGATACACTKWNCWGRQMTDCRKQNAEYIK